MSRSRLSQAAGVNDTCTELVSTPSTAASAASIATMIGPLGASQTRPARTPATSMREDRTCRSMAACASGCHTYWTSDAKAAPARDRIASLVSLEIRGFRIFLNDRVT